MRKQRLSSLSKGAQQEPGCPGPVLRGNIQPTPPAGEGEITGEGSEQPLWPSSLQTRSFSKYCPQPKGNLTMDRKLIFLKKLLKILTCNSTYFHKHTYE